MTRQIQFLHPHRMADGRTSWHWKPSPRLRKAGWTNQALGITEGRRASGEIVAEATAWNDKLAAWEQGTAAVAGAQPAPRKWRFCDLVTAYRASEHFRQEIKPATRKEYESRIRQLEYWAEDGKLFLAEITPELVEDLKKELLASPEGAPAASKFKCAAMLRVLRILMRFAVKERAIGNDPTRDVPIPTPPSRSAKLAWPSVRTIAEECRDTLAARALRIGFWSMQRREDLRQFNLFQWQELHGADPRDLPALVNARGQVWGFRLQPNKTETTTARWVDCPMPPWLHAEIEQAFKDSQWLFPHPQDPAKPIPGHLLRRRVKPVLVAGGFPTHQLRDLRRSGMSGVKDLGAMKSDVFAISGHPLDGQQRTMADVYMPPDTMAACRAIAAACRTLAAIEAREQEQVQ